MAKAAESSQQHIAGQQHPACGCMDETRAENAKPKYQSCCSPTKQHHFHMDGAKVCRLWLLPQDAKNAVSRQEDEGKELFESALYNIIEGW